jgi:tRNA threonylcarbamoyladenosine modification (KEOPS) complex Cgi121 subunit
MLKSIEEFGKYVEIAGFKECKISDVDGLCEQTGKLKRVEVQFFNAQRIATWQHLYFAALNAVNAFESKINVSKSLAIEMIRFASARRQIREAMLIIGIKAGCSRIAVTTVGDDEKKVDNALSMVAGLINGKRDDTVLELTPKKTKEIEETFEISPMELESVTMKEETDRALLNLVLERMALVSTQR